MSPANPVAWKLLLTRGRRSQSLIEVAVHNSLENQNSFFVDDHDLRGFPSSQEFTKLLIVVFNPFFVIDRKPQPQGFSGGLPLGWLVCFVSDKKGSTTALLPTGQLLKLRKARVACLSM